MSTEKEIMEDNPDLPYEFVKKAILAEAEKKEGNLESYDFGSLVVNNEH